MEICTTSVFDRWFRKLKNSNAKFRIDRQIRRLANGNPGDVKPIGEGCSEMRIDYGIGYRVYYKQIGLQIVILLCGGDKSTQDADISDAKKIARELEVE